LQVHRGLKVFSLELFVSKPLKYLQQYQQFFMRAALTLTRGESLMLRLNQHYKYVVLLLHVPQAEEHCFGPLPLSAQDFQADQSNPVLEYPGLV